VPQSIPRVVVVTRATELDSLIARHGTREQARFFVKTHGQDLAALEERDRGFDAALELALRGIPVRWRSVKLDRSELNRFVFEESDVVLAVGQDGLVANVAKYLSGQAVIGINPDARLYEGVLAAHRPSDAAELLRATVAGAAQIVERTMVEAAFDDGQRLLALNEIFVGHGSHQSARYRLQRGDVTERQSSSGVIVATGTGSSGWARSIALERRFSQELPAPTSDGLAFFVREAFPGSGFEVALTDGLLERGSELVIASEMNDGGVVFGDGIEDDRIDFSYGTHVTLRRASEHLRVVVG
jgi:NAD kinase